MQTTDISVRKARKRQAVERKTTSEAGASRKARKGGKLARLQDFPLDVLYEIFAALNPYDLLRLGRATKALRSVVMSRSARSVWMRSFKNIDGLPSCPDGMTEPAWAHLAFEPVCDVCGTTGVRNILWSLRLRACLKCMTTETSIFAKRYLSTCPRGLIDAVTSYPCIPHDRAPCNLGGVLFLQTEFDEAMRTIRTLESDPILGQSRLDGWAKRTRASRDHSAACQAWLERIKSQRADDIDATRQRRKDAIIDRLDKMGYDREVDWMGGQEVYDIEIEFDALKGVKQPKDLTLRTWNSIQPEVVAFMNRVRSWRQVDLQLSSVRQRIELLVSALRTRTTSYLPRAIDLYSFGPIHALIDRPLENDDADTVTLDDFTNVVSNFDDILAHCRSRRVSHALDALRAAPDRPLEDVREDDLNLATSLFRCHSVGGICSSNAMTLQDTLVHHCPTRYWPRREHWFIVDRQEQAELVSHWVDDAGGNVTLRVHLEARARAVHLIKLAGLDPESSTFDDMDALNPLSECSCVPCVWRTQRDQRRIILDWRQAVNHCVSPLELKRPDLTSEQAARTAYTQYQIRLPIGDTSSILWVCVHCRQDLMRSERLRAHCREQHGVSDPAHSVDFVVGASFARPGPTVGLKVQYTKPKPKPQPEPELAFARCGCGCEDEGGEYY